MCNDYAREIEAGRVIRLMKEMENIPFEWEAGRIPNDAGPTPHVKITEKGLIARLKSDKVVASMTTWAWKTPTGKPVFNFVSEHRDFSNTERCLILATSFYEYTTPEKSIVKLKDQHLFTMKGEEWFWIAGIVKHNAFAMLTTEPGLDMELYHDRQIVVLRPEQGMHWLRLDRPEAEILAIPPKNTLIHRQTRKDGLEIASGDGASA